MNGPTRFSWAPPDGLTVSAPDSLNILNLVGSPPLALFCQPASEPNHPVFRWTAKPLEDSRGHYGADLPSGD
jgi:hypothetical protein